MTYAPLKALATAWKQLLEDEWTLDIRDLDQASFEREWTVGDYEVKQYIVLGDSISTSTIVRSISAQETAEAEQEAWRKLKQQRDEEYEREFCRLNQLNYEQETQQKPTSGFSLFSDRPIDRKLDRDIGAFLRVAYSTSGISNLIAGQGINQPSTAIVPAEPEKPKWIKPPPVSMPEFPKYSEPITFNFLVKRDITEDGIKTLVLFS